MVNHNFAMFGGHWSSASENKEKLLFHLSSQNHLIQGSFNFLSKCSSLFITTLPSLVVFGIVVVRILWL